MRTAVAFAGTLVIITVTVGVFYGARWFHWNVLYEPRAKALVCEMVRPEALVEECEG